MIYVKRREKIRVTYLLLLEVNSWDSGMGGMHGQSIVPIDLNCLSDRICQHWEILRYERTKSDARVPRVGV